MSGGVVEFNLKGMDEFINDLDCGAPPKMDRWPKIGYPVRIIQHRGGWNLENATSRSIHSREDVLFSSMFAMLCLHARAHCSQHTAFGNVAAYQEVNKSSASLLQWHDRL